MVISRVDLFLERAGSRAWCVVGKYIYIHIFSFSVRINQERSMKLSLSLVRLPDQIFFKSTRGNRENEWIF